MSSHFSWNKHVNNHLFISKVVWDVKISCRQNSFVLYVCWGLNSHYFHTIGDKLIRPIVGVHMPILRIPVIKSWDEFMANISSSSTLAHILNYMYSKNATKVSIRNSPVSYGVNKTYPFSSAGVEFPPPVFPGGFFQGKILRKTREINPNSSINTVLIWWSNRGPLIG